MRRYVLMGEKYVWLFFAPNQKKGREIANIILSFERFSLSKIISGLDHGFGVWQAVGCEPEDEEIKDLLQSIQLSENTKVVEIKKRRPPKIDAIYLTRPQRERWATG